MESGRLFFLVCILRTSNIQFLSDFIGRCFVLGCLSRQPEQLEQWERLRGYGGYALAILYLRNAATPPKDFSIAPSSVPEDITSTLAPTWRALSSRRSTMSVSSTTNSFEPQFAHGSDAMSCIAWVFFELGTNFSLTV